MKYKFKEGKGLQDVVNIIAKYMGVMTSSEIEALSNKNYKKFIALKESSSVDYSRDILNLFEEVPEVDKWIGELGVFSDEPITKYNELVKIGILKKFDYMHKGYTMYMTEKDKTYNYFMPLTEYQKLLRGEKWITDKRDI